MTWVTRVLQMAAGGDSGLDGERPLYRFHTGL